MSLAYAVLYLEGTAEVLAYGVKNSGIAPEHVTFEAVFRPSAHIKMEQSVFSFEDIAAPETHIVPFDTIVDVAVADCLGTPVGTDCPASGHSLEAVHKPPSIHQIIPFGRTGAFGDLRPGGQWHHCRHDDI